jgi:hypothetical protein
MQQTPTYFACSLLAGIIRMQAGHRTIRGRSGALMQPMDHNISYFISKKITPLFFSKYQRQEV